MHSGNTGARNHLKRFDELKIEILWILSSNFSFKDPIKLQFRTCNDSSAVVTYANLRLDSINVFAVRTTLIFIRYEILQNPCGMSLKDTYQYKVHFSWYRNSHYKDKMVTRLYYLLMGILALARWHIFMRCPSGCCGIMITSYPPYTFMPRMHKVSNMSTFLS